MSRPLSTALREIAGDIMRHCNEAPECPFCGADGFSENGDEHDPEELCARLDAALTSTRAECLPTPCRDAGEVVCEVIRALALPVPDDVDPTDLPGYAVAVAIVDRCLDRAREEGAEAAADRRDDEREYARSRGVR